LTGPDGHRTVAGIVTDPAPPTNPLPLRVRWFAVWTWPWRTWVMVATPVLLVAYVLSMGPAVWLASQHPRLTASIAAFYRPLLFVRHRDIDVHHALDRYMYCWSVRGGLTVVAHHRTNFEKSDRDGTQLRPYQEGAPAAPGQ
jgi:hypothetical protein